MIESDTIKLLRECDAGIKMGVSSIDEVFSRVISPGMRGALSRCKREHKMLENECNALLNEFHDEGKSPNPLVQSMSYIKTEFQMAVNESDSEIASLMTDGCNMGIKSLNKYLNEYKAADERSKDITKKLIKQEQDLTSALSAYL